MRTINSLFRIDRTALQHENDPILIPGLPRELLPQSAVETEDSEETSAEREHRRLQRAREDELAQKQKELEDLQHRIETTKQEIEVMKQQAEIEAGNIRDEAKRAGYQDGIAEAKQEFQQVLSTEQREFKRSVETLAHARDEINREIEDSVLDLSLYIAEKIVKESLKRDDKLFLNIVKETIEQVKDQEDLVLRLNKKEYDRFFRDDKDEFAALLKSSGIKVKQDMAVESGEFVIESEFGTLRSGIQTQLERMRSALTEAG